MCVCVCLLCMCWFGKLYMIWHAPTSILRPSTTVPCRRSRARSASLLLANVTKPNPCHSQSNMQLKKHIEYIDYDFQKN